MIKETDGDSYEKCRSLNQNLTFDYTEKIFENADLSFGLSQKKTLGLIGEDDLYTNLALLLSDQCNHTLKVAVFEGIEKNIFKDRKEFKGSLLKQVTETFEFINLINKTEATFAGLTRKDERDYPLEAIREALVNTLIHADYLQNFPKVKIEMFDGWINFENSGKMLITKDEYVQGGNSVIRNETLVQLVRLIGIAERQGFGGVKICKTSESLFKQQPEIITDLRETKLKLWTVDALHFREDLSVLDKKIYHILLKNNQPLTRKEIISISENTEHFVKKSLINLLEKGLITTIGNGRSTKYEISFGTQGYLTKIQMKLQTLAKLNSLFSED